MTAAMSSVEALWVREHVWTKTMRQTNRFAVNAVRMCACQSGESFHCTVARCGECRRGEPLPAVETFVTRKDESVLYFAKPYANRSICSATGPHLERAAQVFLADRLCRWVCSCECHRRGHVVRDQLDMLDLIGRAP